MNTILRFYYNTIMRGFLTWLWKNDEEAITLVNYTCDRYVKHFDK